MRTKQGFTYIELLVVLVIISITTTWVVLRFGDFGQQRAALMSTQIIKQQWQRLQLLAITTDAVLEINTHNAGYSVRRWDSQQQIWQAMPQLSETTRYRLGEGQVHIFPDYRLSPTSTLVADQWLIRTHPSGRIDIEQST